MSARLSVAVLVVLVVLSPTRAAEGKKYALLVGVKTYDDDDLSSLKYTENDAEETAKALMEGGYEVAVMTNTRGEQDATLKPTAKNIRAQLKKLCDKATKDDLLLLGLAGHGLFLPATDAKTKKSKDVSFFCPSDAKPRGDETLDELKKTLIPLGELFETLEASEAKARLLLVDACRSDGKGAGRNPDVEHLTLTKEGTAVLFSCKTGERAFETAKRGKGHGVFFFHAAEGLRGKAKDKGGDVTWASLVDHVVAKVSEDVPVVIGKGAKQTPHEIKNLESLPVLIAAKGNAADVQRWFETGENYRDGGSVEKDDKEAVRWYRKAAEKGHVDAMTSLGFMYAEGRGVDKDDKEAVRWYKKAAEKGEAEAACLLGWAYAVGEGVDKDYKEAARWFRKAADKGNAEAMSSLGLAYENGLGVDKDEKEAVTWYKKAADKNHAAAMAALGCMHESGRGVDKDVKEAVKWFRKAADKDDARAMTSLGFMYAEGRGVDKDDKEAVRWYKKAAEKDYPAAMDNLGAMYESGRGVNQDDKEAVKWLRKAADKGHADAMTKLGARSLFGRGVEKDQKKAVEWFRRAADKGNPAASCILGTLYENGLGVEKDVKEALKWFKKAAALGEPRAKKKVAELE